ncbi:MAG: hypothetical protein WCV80_03770 [Candidatus Paceibacterota bacterium]|jgi:hypothetical protein
MKQRRKKRTMPYIVQNIHAQRFRGHDFRRTTHLLDGSEIKIILTREVCQKMFYIVDESPQEVSWLGSVTRHNMEFLIDEIFIFEQKVHSSETRLDEEAVGKFFTELLQRNDGIGKSNRIRAWMHSHVIGSTSPSGTYGPGNYGDLAQMHSFGQGADYFIMGIANKSGELRFDIYFYTLGIKIEDVPWEIVEEENTELHNAIKEELKSKVTSAPHQFIGRYQIFPDEEVLSD